MPTRQGPMLMMRSVMGVREFVATMTQGTMAIGECRLHLHINHRPASSAYPRGAIGRLEVDVAEYGGAFQCIDAVYIQTARRPSAKSVCQAEVLCTAFARAVAKTGTVYRKTAT